MDIDTTNLSLNHLQVIIRGMYEVAASDEVHQSEMVMMRELYEQCRRDAQGLADFDDIIRQPFNPESAGEIINTDELRNIFMTSCLFLAFADGEYTDPEKDVIQKLAGHIGMEQTRLDELTDSIRDYLLVQISKVQNLDALQEIASRMK